MKKLISLIFALTAFLCISAGAETVGGDCGYYGGPNVKWSYDSETKTLSFIGQGIMADYYSTVYTPWYPYKSQIEKVFIGDGVTTTGINALELLDALEELRLPSTLTEIRGRYPLGSCKPLRELTIPAGFNNLDNFMTTINCIWEHSTIINADEDSPDFSSEDGILYSKDKTVLVYCPAEIAGESFTVPDSVKKIDEMAFHYCKNLKRVDLPDGLQYIEASAFSDCTSLKEIRIPDKVFYMGNAIFSGCGSLRSVVFPANLDIMNTDFMFNGCQDLVIYALSGSRSELYALGFARNEGITCVAI